MGCCVDGWKFTVVDPDKGFLGELDLWEKDGVVGCGFLDFKEVWSFLQCGYPSQVGPRALLRAVELKEVPDFSEFV